MGSDIKRLNELMERLQALSEEQSGHLRDLRLVEMLKAQAERDGIFDELKRLKIKISASDGLKTVAKRIEANDRQMMVNMLSTMDEIKNNLNKIRNGRKAAKAYAG